MVAIVEVDDSNFEEEVIKRSSERPVVVDFYAVWCMPCKLIGPVLEKLAEQYGGKFILAKLNVDMSPKTSAEYGIMSIPSVKIFKEGKVVDEFIGALPEPMIEQWLEKNLE